jgi:hypothetical protein
MLDEVIRPPAWKVQEILKETREILIGLTYGDSEGWLERTPEHKTMFVMTICDQVKVLDLFLTGSLRVREVKLDVMGAINVLIGESWAVLLSDNKSILVIRKPTKEDQRYLYLDAPARQVAFRWTLIDTVSAQPTEFVIREDFLQ